MRSEIVALSLALAASAGPWASLQRRDNVTDIQSSLTLDSSVIATGFADDGQNPPVDGQSASLTSTNNFINFCALTLPGVSITNGLQNTAGSCNPAPMGQIPSTANMPSVKFISPTNGDSFPVNTSFTITMAVKNMQVGVFTNAEKNYFAAPQTVNAQGQIIGHTHFTIDFLDSLDDTKPTNPNNFAYFKGINTAADANGVVSLTLAAGLPVPGAYRLASINSAANHQPVVVPIAQHGSLDDMIYFTITDTADTANTTASATAIATASSVDTASSSLDTATVSVASALSATESTVDTATAIGTTVAAGSSASASVPATGGRHRIPHKKGKFF